MAITDIPILSMLRRRMEWTQTRQRVLAENVANADTPHYQARDLTPLKFPEPDTVSASGVTPVTLVTTEPRHMSGFGAAQSQFPEHKSNYGVQPTGNAVNIEQEMMKVAANQMDYEAVTSIYTHDLTLIKTAIDSKA